MIKRKDIVVIAAAGLLSALAGRTAAAHGVLLDPNDGRVRTADTVAVQADVLGQVAGTTVELTFRQSGPGTHKFMFPTPKSASVTGFAVRRGGVWQEATVAAEAPEQAGEVRTGGAGGGRQALPAQLLEWLGEGAFVVDVPVGDDDVVTQVQVRYIEVLPYDFGEVSYTFPLAGWPGASERHAQVSVGFELTTRRDLRGWRVDRFAQFERAAQQEARALSAHYAFADTRLDSDFRLTWSVEQEELFFDLLTHHDSCDEDGYFLLIVEPRHEVSETEVAPKYFTFVVDTSGSMSDGKMEQARRAAQFMVAELNERDRFNVVSFSSTADRLFDRAQDYTPDNRRTAERYIERLWAGGGTNLEEALREALGSGAGGGRGDAEGSQYARLVVLLTDGEPTAGVTYTPEILDSVQRANVSGARVFPFGVGAGLGRSLLTALAAENRGDATFFDRGGDIEQVLTDFYKRIDRPVLTGVSVDFGGADVHHTDLDDVTDLFAGTQLLVVGRYRAGADVQGALEGSLGGVRQKRHFPLRFDDCAEGELPILPRLWAKARIDALVAEMARAGREDPAKVAEIERLGARYGIQTPYTSFDVAPPPAAPPPGPPQDPYSDYEQDYDYDYDYDSSHGGGWYGGDIEELEAREAVYGCATGQGAPARRGLAFLAIVLTALVGVRRRRRA